MWIVIRDEYLTDINFRIFILTDMDSNYTWIKSFGYQNYQMK